MQALLAAARCGSETSMAAVGRAAMESLAADDIEGSEQRERECLGVVADEQHP